MESAHEVEPQDGSFLQLSEHTETPEPSTSTPIKGKKRSQCTKMCCNECGILINSKGLKEHTDSVHNKKRFKCDKSDCKKQFVRKKDLKDHEKVHEDNKIFSCIICGVIYSLERNLKKHMKEGCCKPADTRTCINCKKTFKNKKLLHQHMAAHKGEKRYPCTMCKKRYQFKSGLNKHCTKKH